MFWLRNKKIKFLLRTLNKNPEAFCNNPYFCICQLPLILTELLHIYWTNLVFLTSLFNVNFYCLFFINSLPASVEICCLLIIFANSLDPDQGPTE